MPVGPGHPGSAVLLFPQLPASPQHPQAPGTANSALEHVLRSEWRKRISAYKAAPKANAQGPGLAGAVRTQKNVIWHSENQNSCLLALYHCRIWHPRGALRKSKISTFLYNVMPAGHPDPPPHRSRRNQNDARGWVPLSLHWGIRAAKVGGWAGGGGGRMGPEVGPAFQRLSGRSLSPSLGVRLAETVSRH
eukprot:gene23349-biopygen19326